jgi:beta-glucosidase
MRDAKSPLARLAFRLLNRMLKKSEAAHKPDLNLLFLFNMPFRAIAKMTNGAVSLQMVEALLLIVNGRFIRGAGGLIRASLRNRRANAQTRKALQATA